MADGVNRYERAPVGDTVPATAALLLVATIRAVELVTPLTSELNEKSIGALLNEKPVALVILPVAEASVPYVSGVDHGYGLLLESMPRTRHLKPAGRPAFSTAARLWPEVVPCRS